MSLDLKDTHYHGSAQNEIKNGLWPETATSGTRWEGRGGGALLEARTSIVKDKCRRRLANPEGGKSYGIQPWKGVAGMRGKNCGSTKENVASVAGRQWPSVGNAQKGGGRRAKPQARNFPKEEPAQRENSSTRKEGKESPHRWRWRRRRHFAISRKKRAK